MSMNIGNLNNFFQALQASQQNAQQQQLRAQQIANAKAEAGAQTAVGKGLVPIPTAPNLSALGSLGQGAPVQQPQTASPSNLSALGALAQGTPAPSQAQGSQQPAPIPTGPVPAGASFAQAFGQQGPSTPAPQTQAPQTQAPQTQAQTDTPVMDDPVVEAQKIQTNIAQNIKAQNPGIDPRTLFLAVQQQLELVRGVSPLTKAAMSAQSAMLSYQLKRDALQQRIASEDQRWQVNRQNANSREERNRIDEAHFKAMEALGQGRIDEGYAGIEEHGMAAAGHDATTLKATEMRDATSRANNADTNARQDRGSNQRQDAQRQQNYRSVYAAYLRAHPKDQAGAVRAAREASGGGAPSSGGGGAPVKVSTPEQARKLPKGTHFVTPDGRQFVA